MKKVKQIVWLFFRQAILLLASGLTSSSDSREPGRADDEDSDSGMVVLKLGCKYDVFLEHGISVEFSDPETYELF